MYKINYENELNENQYKAVIANNGPISIIAGAGSGKTRTIMYKIARLIEDGILPEQILVLTFTNAAANEIKSRAASMLDDRCNHIAAGTFHSFAAYMLRIYGKTINIPNNFTILAPGDCADAIGFIKAESNDKYKIKGFPQNSKIISIYSTAINKQIPISDVLLLENYNRYAGYENILTDLFKEYVLYKKSRNVFDYDDLLINFRTLLKNQRFNEYINRKYAYIMVDEYQDTNKIQEDILFLMRKTNNNFTVVGDDYQSIYAFRGSEVNNFINFSDKVPGCTKIVLDANYRSTQEILDLANLVMKKHANFGIEKQMYSSNKLHADKPILCSPTSQRDEARQIYEYIATKQLTNHNAEIAVLCRNTLNTFALEEQLLKHGIQYNKMGGKKLMEYECVQDVLAYMRCIINRFDVLAWFRILQLHEGIGDTYARRISSNCNIDDFLRENKYKKNIFYKELLIIDEKIREWRAAAEIHSVSEILDKIIKFYDDLQVRNIQNMKTDSEDNRKKELAEHKKNMKVLEKIKPLTTGYKNINAFLDALMLESTKTSQQSECHITLSTIHSAKGLEWDNVCIMDCVDGSFPKVSPMEFYSEKDNEELRCFYVAMTRAKKQLVIYAPLTIEKYGRFEVADISHYLNGCDKMYDTVSTKKNSTASA